MTTVAYTSVLAQSTDAEFRAWGLELNTKLAEAGLVQTADTGQINWTTVVKPTANSVAGYEIWRFADSSLYLKLEYGAGPSALGPNFWVTVGQGSNGSGTLTGTLSTRDTNGLCPLNGGPNSTTTPYTTYISRTADHLALVFKMNGFNGLYPWTVLVIGKTVDVNGTPNALGFGVLHTQASGTGSYRLQCVRYAASASIGNVVSAGWCAYPGDVVSAMVGADPQVFPIWSHVPQVQSWPWACLYPHSDIGKQSSFSVALTGSTPRTYLATGNSGSSPPVTGPTAARVGVAILYE